MVKSLPANAGDIRDIGLIPGLGRSPWRKAWQPTQVFLPRKSHGQRSLVDYSPWGREGLGHDFTTNNQIFILNMVYSYLSPFGLSWPVFFVYFAQIHTLPFNNH